MDLSPTHFHLLLNHFPTIGFIIGLGVFVAALLAKSDHLKQAGLLIIVGIALLTIPTFTTGSAAQAALVKDAGVSANLMEQHEGAAFIALMLMQVAGLAAYVGLWQYRRQRMLPGWNAMLVLVLGLVSLAVVSRAAALGGEIRHPEIRVTPDTTVEQVSRTIGNIVRDTPWIWVASEALHFVGLSLLIGVCVLVCVRALGLAKQIPFAAVDRLLPWAVLGLGLNVVTGMLFFLAAPQQYVDNPAFHWKLIFLVLAGGASLFFFFDEGWAAKPGSDAPALTKLVAAAALFLWVGVMFWGSMLPFIGNAF